MNSHNTIFSIPLLCLSALVLISSFSVLQAKSQASEATIVQTAKTEGNDPEHDLQLWPVTIFELPIIEDKLSLYSETIPFVVKNVTELSRIQIRGALVYKPTNNLSLWAGADYFPGLSEDATEEQRLWQQIRFTKNKNRLSLDTRFRLEERFIDKESTIALRNRNRLKVNYALGKKQKNYLAAADEIFFNLNSVNDGLQAGLSENRIYAGIGRKINKYLSLEAGYMLSYAWRPNRADFVRHIFRIETNIKLPALIKRP